MSLILTWVTTPSSIPEEITSLIGSLNNIKEERVLLGTNSCYSPPEIYRYTYTLPETEDPEVQDNFSELSDLLKESTFVPIRLTWKPQTEEENKPQYITAYQRILEYYCQTEANIDFSAISCSYSEETWSFTILNKQGDVFYCDQEDFTELCWIMSPSLIMGYELLTPTYLGAYLYPNSGCVLYNDMTLIPVPDSHNSPDIENMKEAIRAKRESGFFTLDMLFLNSNDLAMCRTIGRYWDINYVDTFEAPILVAGDTDQKLSVLVFSTETLFPCSPDRWLIGSLFMIYTDRLPTIQVIPEKVSDNILSLDGEEREFQKARVLYAGIKAYCEMISINPVLGSFIDSLYISNDYSLMASFFRLSEVEDFAHRLNSNMESSSDWHVIKCDENKDYALCYETPT